MTDNIEVGQVWCDSDGDYFQITAMTDDFGDYMYYMKQKGYLPGNSISAYYTLYRHADGTLANESSGDVCECVAGKTNWVVSNHECTAVISHCPYCGKPIVEQEGGNQ